MGRRVLTAPDGITRLDSVAMGKVGLTPRPSQTETPALVQAFYVEKRERSRREPDGGPDCGDPAYFPTGYVTFASLATCTPTDAPGVPTSVESPSGVNTMPPEFPSSTVPWPTICPSSLMSVT